MSTAMDAPASLDLDRAGRFIRLAPVLMMGGILLGAIAAGLGYRNDSGLLQVAGSLLCFVSFIQFPVLMGKAATALGKNWVLYGLLPLLLPVLFLIGWLHLWASHRDLVAASPAA